MKRQNILLMVCFLAIPSAFSDCRKSVAENNQELIQTAPIVSLTPEKSLTTELNSHSQIKKIDFKNFTYPWTEELSTKDEKSFTLKNGEIPFEREDQMGVSLVGTEYSDVTGDKEDEAILTITIQTGGTAVPNLVYIYTLENKKPKLLWNFDTGDRAEGGLKKIYAENGELLVETFGENKFENDKWEFNFPKDKFSGYCCPTAYTKIRFKWNGNKFIAHGEPELFDYDWRKEQNKNQTPNPETEN